MNDLGGVALAPQHMTQPILEMRDITKTFPGVKALSNVNLSIMPAEIHAVVGENGAGKSTLMKVLSGVYPPAPMRAPSISKARNAISRPLPTVKTPASSLSTRNWRW